MRVPVNLTQLCCYRASGAGSWMCGKYNLGCKMNQLRARSEEIKRKAGSDAFWEALTYSAILGLIGGVIVFYLIKSSITPNTALGLSLAAGVGSAVLGFRFIHGIAKARSRRDVTCSQCNEAFALVTTSRKDLLTAVPRVERSTFQSNAGSDHGMRNLIREETWVEETYRVTVDSECIHCRHRSSRSYTETKKTGYNTGEYPA
jgi:hypothetical protein